MIAAGLCTLKLCHLKLSEIRKMTHRKEESLSLQKSRIFFKKSKQTKRFFVYLGFNILPFALRTMTNSLAQTQPFEFFFLVLKKQN